MPAFTDTVLHGGPSIYGYLMASFGIGGILATVIMASFSISVRGGRLGLLSLGCTATLIIILSQSKHPLVACPLFTAVGFSMLLFRVNNNTLIQILSPDSLRGKITSIYQMGQAFTPLAALILGGITDLYCAPVAMATSGIVGLLSLTTLFCFVRAIRNLRHLRI